MRRFIEEIRVSDPVIANKIVEALEHKTKTTDPTGHTIECVEPDYEVEMYEHHRDFDIMRNKPEDQYYVRLKIFIKENA